MIVKGYSNNDLVFEAEFDIESPISNILIEKGFKEEPSGYYDNSLEGLNKRINTKTTNDDIKVFNNNLDKLNISSEIVDLFLSLETGKDVSIDIDTFNEFSEAETSFLKNLYDNIMDEYESEAEETDTLILSF